MKGSLLLSVSVEESKLWWVFYHIKRGSTILSFIYSPTYSIKILTQTARFSENFFGIKVLGFHCLSVCTVIFNYIIILLQILLLMSLLNPKYSSTFTLLMFPTRIFVACKWQTTWRKWDDVLFLAHLMCSVFNIYVTIL